MVFTRLYEYADAFVVYSILEVISVVRNAMMSSA